jgi:hypothetical protein
MEKLWHNLCSPQRMSFLLIRIYFVAATSNLDLILNVVINSKEYLEGK